MSQNHGVDPLCAHTAPGPADPWRKPVVRLVITQQRMTGLSDPLGTRCLTSQPPCLSSWLLEAVAQLHTGAPGCTGPPWGSPTATALEFRPAPTPACAHLEVWGDGGAEAWRRGFPRAWSSGEGRPASLLCRAQLDDTPPTAPASFPLPPRSPHSGPWSYTPR